MNTLVIVLSSDIPTSFIVDVAKNDKRALGIESFDSGGTDSVGSTYRQI